MAYNPSGDGRYAWWRQNLNKDKRVFIHDQMGQVTEADALGTADVLGFGTIWTAPVTATFSSQTTYVALFGVPEVHAFSFSPSQVWKEYTSTVGQAYQVALRAMPAEVLALVRVPDGAAYQGTATLRLLRFAVPGD